MRLLFTLSLACLMFLPGQALATELLGPIYPDAVPYSSEQPEYFLSKDPYEKVKTYYKEDSRGVVKERTLDGARVAWIEYMSVTEVQKYDSIGSALGVEVFEQPSRQSKAADVLGMLKGMMMNGMLSKAEYDRLVKEYKPVCQWFFPWSDEDGQPLDVSIYEDYEHRPEDRALKQDTDAMAIRIQELMKQGKQQEAMQVMQQMAHSVEEHHAEHGTGQAGVERWKECLAELKRNGYLTRIRNALHPAASLK